jgi:hypothetical protein
VRKKYKARVNPNVKVDQGGVRHIELYAGKVVYLKNDKDGRYSGFFRGRLPKSNDKWEYCWSERDLIDIQEITEEEYNDKIQS